MPQPTNLKQRAQLILRAATARQLRRAQQRLSRAESELLRLTQVRALHDLRARFRAA